MTGNSQQCRLNAVHCLALAGQAISPDSRRDFIALADTWNRLAAELESDEALLQAMSEMELSEPCYDLPLALGIRSWAA
jgi:hypothetical protein